MAGLWHAADGNDALWHDPTMHPLTARIADIGDAVRYVAVSEDGGEPELWEREPDRADSSSPESDRYEELLVNPTLLTLAGRRGNIDCGGLDYIVIRYRAFFQLVIPTDTGHVSVCLAPDADVPRLTDRILQILAEA